MHAGKPVPDTAAQALSSNPPAIAQGSGNAPTSTPIEDDRLVLTSDQFGRRRREPGARLCATRVLNPAVPGGVPWPSLKRKLVTAVAEGADLTKRDAKRALTALDEIVASGAQQRREGPDRRPRPAHPRVKPAQKNRKGRSPRPASRSRSPPSRPASTSVAGRSPRPSRRCIPAERAPPARRLSRLHVVDLSAFA